MYNDGANRFRQSPRFRTAIRYQGLIFEAWKTLQDSEVPDYIDLGPLYVLAEYNSVILNLPRQVGKTTSLVHILEQSVEDTILFTHNHNIARHIEYVMNPRPGSTIMSIHSVVNKFRGKTFKYKNILLDEPGHYDRSQFAELISVISTNAPHELVREIKIFGLGTS